jgi:hypothetical protein
VVQEPITAEQKSIWQEPAVLQIGVQFVRYLPDSPTRENAVDDILAYIDDVLPDLHRHILSIMTALMDRDTYDFSRRELSDFQEIQFCARDMEQLIAGTLRQFDALSRQLNERHQQFQMQLIEVSQAAFFAKISTSAEFIARTALMASNNLTLKDSRLVFIQMMRDQATQATSYLDAIFPLPRT